MEPISWIEAIKALMVMMPKLMDLITRLGAQMKERSFQEWVTELDQTTQALEKAKSLRERIDAAKKLSDLARRL